ncbi:EEP domain-containing protein [Alkalilimnicola sp. S0819]|nr:EEP domain-containing protein [Alkalilimnicola sp. S0819]MPQ16544.1 EEP domain-containing protein [Alkalilimnicola sp. S0819]
MSYNIQTGIETRQYHHYLTRSWKHVLPHAARQDNLDRIAGTICDYDIVGLQEVDAGSFRSGFVNQVHYLAGQGAFPYCHFQTNRRIGRLARHSNGLLSRFRPLEMREHKLPGMIPGRGALVVRFGGPQADLSVVLLHLALSRRARMNQMDFVAELIQDLPHAVVMGDFNCHSRAPELERLLHRTRLMEPLHHLHTYPSWRPQKNIDHILVSDELEVRSAAVLDCPLSDHLPITMEIALPADVELVA